MIDYIFCERIKPDIKFCRESSEADFRPSSATGLKQIQGTLPGERIIELFPFLGYLPMALKPWEKEGRDTYKEDLAWCRERMKVS